MDIVQSSNRVVNSFPPLNNITPFTRVDGWSFLEVLEGLRYYVVNTLVDEINERNEIITDQMNAWFDQYLIDHAKILSDIEKTKDGWEDFFNQFMDDVVARLEVLNDAAVQNLINNPNSLTRKALLSSIEKKLKPSAISRFQGFLSLSVDAPVYLVFLGSSTTEGATTVTPENRYVNRFAKSIDDAYKQLNVVTTNSIITASGQVALASNGVKVVNGGISGKTTKDYFPSNYETLISKFHNVCVFHMIGSNDSAYKIPVAEYEANIISTINKIDNARAVKPVHILIHSYERMDGEGTGRVPWAEYGEALKRIASADVKHRYFVNMDEEYKSVGIPLSDDFSMMTSDKVHQNDRGHSFMADILRDALHVPSSQSKIAGSDGVPELRALDRFVGATETTITARTPEKGESWQLSEGDLNWDVVGGVATPRGASVAWINTSAPDHGVEVKLKFSEPYNNNSFSYGAVLGGRPLTGQSYRAYFSGNTLYLSRMSSSGTLTVLESIVFSRVADVEYNLKVHKKSGNIAVYVNGDLFLSHRMTEDEIYFASNLTWVGMRASGLGVGIFRGLRGYTL